MEKGSHKYTPSERIIARKVTSLRLQHRQAVRIDDTQKVKSIVVEIEELEQQFLNHKPNTRCRGCNTLIASHQSMCKNCAPNTMASVMRTQKVLLQQMTARR